ncbi:hypothetical protein BaRGS_00026578 [Batillaria attramentaria]|uniref:Uncharacterized protein n=1 Tax=Batillaria attramentaria TaxID=370345 RepID=A0ABD0K4P8_9CAEN
MLCLLTDGPASFTGRFRRVVDKDSNFFVEGRIYYDRDNRRIREFEFEDINHQRAAYDILTFYNLNLQYTLDLRTRKCNVSEPYPVRMPYGVPSGSRFRWEGTLGLVGVPNESVPVAFFDGVFNGTDPYLVGVTEPDCFPVEFHVFDKTNGFYHRE